MACFTACETPAYKMFVSENNFGFITLWIDDRSALPQRSVQWCLHPYSKEVGLIRFDCFAIHFNDFTQPLPYVLTRFFGG